MQYVERFRGCQTRWRSATGQLLDLLLPWACVACGLPAAAPGICPGCRAGLPWCRQCCSVCALPTPAARDAVCGNCLSSPPGWDAVLAAFWYRFPVRPMIQRFKFSRDRAAGGLLSTLLAASVAERQAALPDLLVPVPLHWRRLAVRGFNQAWDIARACSRQLRIPLRNHDLRRTRHTARQSGLDARARAVNLRDAFAWHGEPLAGRHVALVDDVLTTGATVTACSRALRRAGAGRISVWVVARA